jgi:hypothetical protein
MSTAVDRAYGRLAYNANYENIGLVSACWRHGVIYQIYPRSFQDADGYGVGDLKGICAARLLNLARRPRGIANQTRNQSLRSCVG